MGDKWNWLRILAIGKLNICEFKLLVSINSVNYVGSCKVT
jgi:hypothetical protein